MKIGKQQELDLKALEDDISNDTTSSSEEESSTTSESSEYLVEIMGITMGDSNKEELHNSEPVVEESKLQQMLFTDLSLDERKEYLHMMKRFPTLFIDGYHKIIGVTVVEHHIQLKEGSKPMAQKL